MLLNRCPKYSSDTGIRTLPPKETLRWVLPLLTKAGLSTPEDITGKDNIGIPVFSIDREGVAEGAVTNYNGKGITPDQAKASAVMEALERYSAEMREDDEIVYGTYAQASENGLTINPADLILPLRTMASFPSELIAWCQAFDLFRGEDVWVPACGVYHPYQPDGDLPLFRYNTNGIASGNTKEEAILHAIFEVIERDAWSIVEYNEHIKRDVIVDEDSIPGQLIARFKEQGVEIHLKDLTSDTGVYTIGAAADDVATKDPEMLSIGVGTHLNPEIACVRTITEVAQSRTTHKHGTKINAQLVKSTRELGYEKIKEINHHWYRASKETVNLSDLPDLATDFVLDDIEVVLEKLMECGFGFVAISDLTRPELNVPVVRVTIPGMEVFAMDQEREGFRLSGKRPAGNW